MPRLSHTRFSRVIVTVVVLAITVLAAVEYHRKSKAVVPDNKPVVAVAAPVKATTPAPAPVTVATAPPQIKPLITQTPDLTKPGTVLAPMWATNNSNTPAAPPVSNTPPAKSMSNPVVKLASDIELPATSDLLARAKSIADGGDLVAARKMLNDALLTGSLSDSDSTAVKKQISVINQTLVFSSLPFTKDPFGGVYEVKSGDKLAAIGNAHGVPFEFLMAINHMTNPRKLRSGQSLKVINGPFHVVVSKSKFTLDVYLGSPAGPDSTYITTFPVGLGTDNSTPTGSWVIKDKVTHPAYFPPQGHPGGVLDPGDPKNPLGPYWLGLEGTDGQAVGAQSYGIHGTIDPDSIGKQSSMGCIRLHNEDVEVVYRMLIAGKSTVLVKN